MLYSLASSALLGWAFIFWWLRRWVERDVEKNPTGWSTLLDEGTRRSVHTLVMRLSDHDVSSDELMDRLVRLYTRFPPTELTMRRLSVLHQSVEGWGTPDEYCVATVYSAAILGLSDALNEGSLRLPIPRTRSCSALPRD